MKPRIFIGSSKESVKIAEKVKSLLDGEYVCQLWCDNFFDLGQCTYHELLKKSLSFDYAIFIGGKDDYVRRESDRTHKYAARDNVYLEFGLYAGILTYARCFFLIQEGCQIASDLLGVNVVFFDKMQDLSKKILTITEKIQKEQKVARISLLPSTSLAVGYFENFLKPVSQAIQKLDAVCIAGKKYDVKNSAKRLEVAIPAKVSEDLRMWSEYVYENHAVEKVTETVKKFIEAYNAMIDEVRTQATTKPDSNYKPLTDDQKNEMNETSIKNWEDKAKEGILYNSSALKDLDNATQGIFSSMMINGVSYDDLEKIGISFSDDYTAGGKIVFDEEKFKTAMDSDPEKVSDLFTGTHGIVNTIDSTLSTYATRYASKNGNSYGVLIEEAGSEKLSLTLTNNSIYKELKDMQETITNLQSQLSTEQDRYISQFTQMERLINQMNSQSSYLSQLGG